MCKSQFSAPGDNQPGWVLEQSTGFAGMWLLLQLSGNQTLIIRQKTRNTPGLFGNSTSHLTHVFPSHTTLSSSISRSMWYSLFALKTAICVCALFSIHILGYPVTCKHRGCGFDESQTTEDVPSVTPSIWKVFMQMSCNLTQDLVYTFDRRAPKIVGSLYFW